MQKNFHHAKTDSEIINCFPALKELRPYLEEKAFVEQVKRQQKQGYQLAYMQDEKKIHSVAGYRILEYMAWGEILYIDELITLAAERGKGYGKTLLHELIEIAKKEGCDQIHLDSGYQRHTAHRLYLNTGFNIAGHHFAMSLE